MLNTDHSTDAQSANPWRWTSNAIFSLFIFEDADTFWVNSTKKNLNVSVQILFHINKHIIYFKLSEGFSIFDLRNDLM